MMLRRAGLNLDALDSSGVFRRLGHRVDARLACGVLGFVALVAAVGPLIVPDPTTPDYLNTLAPPGPGHPLGTDDAGRDLLGYTVWGARASLGAALLVTLLTATIGLVIGVVSGCVGGLFDTVVSRVIDILLGLPGLVVALAIVGLLGPGMGNLILAMSVTGWAAMARIARSVSRQRMLTGDVVAAKMAGSSPLRVAVEHVLPAVAGSVAVVATLGIGEVVIAIAGLSFLGLGVQPPTPEWGAMLADSRQTLSYAPWQIIGPGVALVTTVLAATTLSEALREVTHPGAAR